MIKLKELFTPNPMETPSIRYGNERRPMKKQPAMGSQETNAMVMHNMPPDLCCEDCGGMISPTGMCQSCGTDAGGHDVWGKPDEGHQSSMARAELKDMIKNSMELYRTIQPGMQLPGWVAAYITLASDYMHSVNEYAQERSQY